MDNAICESQSTHPLLVHLTVVQHVSLHLPGRRRIYLTASLDSNRRRCSIFLCFRASDYRRILENGFCDVCTANSISGRISAHDDGCVDRLHCSFSPFGKRKLWTRTSILMLWACRRRQNETSFLFSPRDLGHYVSSIGVASYLLGVWFA